MFHGLKFQRDLEIMSFSFLCVSCKSIICSDCFPFRLRIVCAQRDIRLRYQFPEGIHNPFLCRIFCFGFSIYIEEGILYAVNMVFVFLFSAFCLLKTCLVSLTRKMSVIAPWAMGTWSFQQKLGAPNAAGATAQFYELFVLQLQPTVEAGSQRMLQRLLLLQMSHEQNPGSLTFHKSSWLFHRHPYHGLL